MSRIGRAPVELPGGVNVELSDRSIKVTGPRGELTVPVGRGVRVEQEDGNLVVRRLSDAPPDRAIMLPPSYQPQRILPSPHGRSVEPCGTVMAAASLPGCSLAAT